MEANLSFVMHMLSGEEIRGTNIADAMRNLQVSHPADLQFKITCIAEFWSVTLMNGFKTVHVIRSLNDKPFQKEIPMSMPPLWLLEGEWRTEDLVSWGGIQIPKTMALPMQCSECLTITTLLGGILQRWSVSNKLADGTEVLPSWCEVLEPSIKFVNNEGIVKFARLCGSCKCDKCCSDEEEFAYHCARCHYPFFMYNEFTQDPNTRMQDACDGTETYDEELWCCVCSGNLTTNSTCG